MYEFSLRKADIGKTIALLLFQTMCTEEPFDGDDIVEAFRYELNKLSCNE